MKNKILNIIILMIILVYNTSCRSDKSKVKIINNEKEKTVEIQVGTKTIITNKFTAKGIPVVPMWGTSMPKYDTINGIGFTVLKEAEHSKVWQPDSREDGAYNHYASLIHYKGKFYALWGNHELGENGPGQRVLYTTSDRWEVWKEAKELFPAPGEIKPRSENGIHFKPDRWAIMNDVLYAVTYVFGTEEHEYPIARSLDENGELGEPFLLDSLPLNTQLPKYMSNLKELNRLLPISKQLKKWYKENDQISWWDSSESGITRTGINREDLIESFIYRAKDSCKVLMMRYWGTPSNPVHNNRMYVSFNSGEGEWSSLYPTDIPDSPSRAQALTLKDGTVLLIGNQIAPYFDKALYLDRNPMTISISKDGYLFDRAYVLRSNSPTTFRFSGIGGRNLGFAYSSSIVLNGYLYTLYSVGKEDLEISKIPLSALGL